MQGVTGSSPVVSTNIKEVSPCGWPLLYWWSFGSISSHSQSVDLVRIPAAEHVELARKWQGEEYWRLRQNPVVFILNRKRSALAVDLFYINEASVWPAHKLCLRIWFAYSTRRSTSLLVRRRVRVYWHHVSKSSCFHQPYTRPNPWFIWITACVFSFSP